MDKCPICGGSGTRIVVTTHRFTNMAVTKVDPCLCYKSAFVSSSVPLLQWLGGEYIPFEEIDSKLQYKPFHKDNPSYVIKAPYKTLCLNIKSLIMNYRFMDPAPNIWFGRAITILQQYYVQQNDGSSPHLSATDSFDLMVVNLDTHEKNDQLKTCIAQVAYTRSKDKKPIWLYIPENKDTLAGCTREYSEELEGIVAEFQKISLDPVGDTGPASPQSMSQIKHDAANFTGL